MTIEDKYTATAVTSGGVSAMWSYIADHQSDIALIVLLLSGLALTVQIVNGLKKLFSND